MVDYLCMTSCHYIKMGGSPCFFVVKLDFEIAVDQQTRARDRTFEGVPDSGASGTAAPIFGKFLAQFCQITLNCS